MGLAVYAGSFDPVTKGHLWMIEQGAALFGRLIVAVGENPEKKTTFSEAERVALLSESMREVDIAGVEIATFDRRYLVQYAGSIGARYMLRGIRSGADYEYERVMRHINEDLCPQITTVFLMPPRHIAEVSSSLVRGMVGPEGWEGTVERFVPHCVLEAFRRRGSAMDQGERRPF
ncbi:MAG TPA: pantetheine-phosphate adenylyltransferase [Verrucomicrobiales bacterium]|nr:pantetheine-phosphate adenylyltransferase [Verrucomicrobiales bacterium]